MSHPFTAVTASVALCLASSSPGLAQDYGPSAFDAPQGAATTLNLRVPLGGRREASRPTLGFTIGYGRTVQGATVDDRPAVRQIRFADLRWNRSGIDRAALLSFDLARPDRDGRLNISTDDRNKKNTLLLVLMAAAGFGALCAFYICDESGEPERSDPTPTPPIDD